LLLTGTTYLTAGSFTDYAGVNITAPTPEPRAFMPVLLCLAGVVLGWARRAAIPPGR